MVIAVGSPGVAVESLPLRSADEVFAGCQGAVVVAPHPDDETLGCGGAIALLQQRAIPVHILVISDGTQSHPRSQLYPATRLRALRETETCAAAQKLGLSAAAVTFLRWPDTAVPHSGNPDFPAAVGDCRHYFLHHSPTTIFTPWQQDRHCDHQATGKIVQRALSGMTCPPRQLAYSIWGSPVAGLPGLPPGETGWRLDIRSVQRLKHRAVMAHRSQTTNLIADDPTGFRLTPTMLNNLIQPWETYLEIV